jgi:hypothetical protein
MEFNLGKFKSTDIIIMATMLSKIGLGKVTDVFGKENVLKILGDNKKEDAAAVVGVGITFQVAEIILGNLEKCQTELFQLLSNVSGMSVEEIKELDAVDFFELIVAVVEMPQFKDFMKVASRLLKSEK